MESPFGDAACLGVRWGVTAVVWVVVAVAWMVFFLGRPGPCLGTVMALLAASGVGACGAGCDGAASVFGAVGDAGEGGTVFVAVGKARAAASEGGMVRFTTKSRKRMCLRAPRGVLFA